MKLGFYFKYIARLFKVERSLTIMTILSIAVGVGILGAIETLGKGVEETLVKNVRQVVGGDLVARARRTPFIQTDLRRMRELKARGVLTEFAPEAAYMSTITRRSVNAVTNFWFISDNYPLYGEKLKALEPAGADVSELLKKGVVVSDYVATKLNIKTGDRIRLGTEPGRSMVAGIVGDEAQPSLDMRVTGFIVRPLKHLKATLKYTPEDRRTAANTIFIKTRRPADAFRAKRAVAKIAPDFSTIETADSRGREYVETTKAIKTGDSAFGFLSLLIVGIGVGHSLRLWAGRRLADVAVFKALGLKAREVKLLFILALGSFSVIGGLLGLTISLGFVFLLKEFARRFAGVPGDFYWFHPLELALVVAATFLVVTAFSLNSVIALSRALPSVALRVGQGDFPRVGFFRRAAAGLASLALLIGAASLTIGDASLAAKVVIGAVTLGFAVQLVFRLLFMALPAGLPLGGLYKIAVRSIKSQMSTATRTALVVLVGITSLSLVVIFSETIKSTLSAELAKQAGYDAFVVVPPGGPAGVKEIIKKTPGGLKTLTEGRVVPIEVVSINKNKKSLKKRLKTALDSPTGDSMIFQFIRTISLVKLSTDRPGRVAAAGRYLRSGDEGRRVAVISGRVAKALKLKIGDTIEPAAGNRSTSLKIVGITSFSQISIGDDLIAPLGAIAGAPRTATSYYLTFKGDKKAAVRWLSRRLQKAVVIDVAAISGAFIDVINGIRVFPLLVSLLALTASVAVIAGGVSISLIKRQRELAILKALGARSRRILGLIGVEHLITGLVGGAAAVGVVTVLAIVLTKAMFKTAGPVNYLAVIAMVDFAAALALFSGLLPAWRAAWAKPLEVLRGE